MPSPTLPQPAPGSSTEVLRAARGITGAYCRLAFAEASLARHALMDAALRGGIALVLALVSATAVAAALVAGGVALGLAWPWAALAVAALAAVGAAMAARSARGRLDDTRFEATRRQLEKLFDPKETP